MVALSRRSYAAFAFAFAIFTSGGPPPPWPSPETPTTRIDEDGIHALIAKQPVCIASSTWSAGTLGESLLYHYRREGNRLYVGYFAHWSAERPWGANPLTYSVVPALALDMVYSHFLFVLPGANSILRGPADVEGATVAYEIREDGTLEPLGALADDWLHRDVNLTKDDIGDDEGHVVLTSNVWSHQLGARGEAAAKANRLRCYQNERLQPMTEHVARAFRLGSRDEPRRAGPAWRLEVPGLLTSPRPPLRAEH